MFQRSKRGGWPYSQSPNVPFEVNWDSPQAKGLVAWWPIFDSRGRTTDVLDKLKRLDLPQFNTPTWVASGRFGPTLFFTRANTEYAEIDVPAVTGTPLTMACWFNTDDVAVNQALVFVGDKDSDINYHYLSVRGAAGDLIRAISRSAAANTGANSTSGCSVDTWHHACGVWASGTSRAAFIDGGSKGVGAVACVPAGLDRTAIGRAGDASPTDYMSGLIADVRIYNRALSDLEVWQLYYPKTRWELYRPLTRRLWAMAPVAPAAAIMNQIQFANVGADLYGGTLIGH